MHATSPSHLLISLSCFLNPRQFAIYQTKASPIKMGGLHCYGYPIRPCALAQSGLSLTAVLQSSSALCNSSIFIYAAALSRREKEREKIKVNVNVRLNILGFYKIQNIVYKIKYIFLGLLIADHNQFVLATLPQHANMDFNHELSLAMGCRLVAIITLAFIILTGTNFKNKSISKFYASLHYQLRWFAHCSYFC